MSCDSVPGQVRQSADADSVSLKPRGRRVTNKEQHKTINVDRQKKIDLENQNARLETKLQEGKNRNILLDQRITTLIEEREIMKQESFKTQKVDQLDKNNRMYCVSRCRRMPSKSFTRSLFRYIPRYDAGSVFSLYPSL